jgi:hypothetical protein
VIEQSELLIEWGLSHVSRSTDASPPAADPRRHSLQSNTRSWSRSGPWLYDDPGADYYTPRDPKRARRNAINKLQRLGDQVTLT